VPGVGQVLVQNYIVGFAEQATRLTGLSILLIFVTATLVVATVEREINLIFGVRRRRGVVRRFIVYAFGLTVGPVLLGASVTATTWLLSQSFGEVPLRDSLATVLARPLPFALAAIALTLVYKVVPARKVSTSWTPPRTSPRSA